MQPESIIRSRQNPFFKQLRLLLRRDRRHQERAFLVEGPRIIADALASGAIPTLLAYSEAQASSADWIEIPGVPTRILDGELFSSISDTVASQGMLAVFPIPVLEPPPGRNPFLLIVDGVQDPGNLGTLIRSAAGAGATQVVALPGTADPWAPKTVRAAAAAHFLVPVVMLSVSELADHLPRPCRLVAADASGATFYNECDFTGPISVIVGSEGKGLSSGTLMLDPLMVSIPLATGLESLNAAVAGSIILFEASRQRRDQSKLTKTLVSG